MKDKEILSSCDHHPWTFPSLLFKYHTLAASPLASSGFAAIGDWKGLCPFQTSIF